MSKTIKVDFENSRLTNIISYQSKSVNQLLGYVSSLTVRD